MVLGVSSDRQRGTVSQVSGTLPGSLRDRARPRADISASYGTFQIPETYLIDRNGKVVEKVISNQNWMDPEFLARVRRML